VSKTTKRVAPALLLLCFFLGGTALYRLRTSSSQETRQAAADQPSAPIAPVVVPSSAAAVAEPVAPPADRAGASVAQPRGRAVVPSSGVAVAEPVAPPGDRARPDVAQAGGSDEGGPARREPEEGRPHRKKTVALAARAAAASKSQEEASAVAAALAMLQPKWGSVAVKLRSRLGVAIQSFEIVKVAVWVDGREVSTLDGKSFHEEKDAVEAWNGTLETGAHILAVVVEYRGNGHVFSYFNQYRYTARSRTLLRVDEGARLQMLVDLEDKGGVNTPFDKRLAIAFAAEH